MAGDLLHYEDIAVSAEQSFGDYLVTREEILEFAARFDPQAFHLDDTAAAASPFGRLSASGWHTAAMTMRMLVDTVFTRQATLGGAGVDKLRWRRPVHPGDRLNCRTRVLSKRLSLTNPAMGIITSRVEAFNQHGECVIRYEATGMIGVRKPAGAD